MKTLICEQRTDGTMIWRDSLLHLVSLSLSLHTISYLFQMTAASHCVWVKLYCTRPLRISPDYSCSPFLSHLLLQSCLFCRWRHAVHCSFSGLWHKEGIDQLKAKNSLIEYWSGIVRQAEMTQVHTWEQGSSLLCIFCCNQLCRPKRCIHQSGITWPCHHCGELWSCGHQSCQNTCGTVGTVMELSNPQYHSTCCTSPLSKGICV